MNLTGDVILDSQSVPKVACPYKMNVYALRLSFKV